MKYALNIGNRFTIVQLLPAEGDLLTMRDAKDLKRDLLPTNKEREEFGIVAEGQNIRWSPEMADVEVEIDFTTPQVALVANALRKLREDKKLREEHVDLWDKFVEEDS